MDPAFNRMRGATRARLFLTTLAIAVLAGFALAATVVAIGSLRDGVGLHSMHHWVGNVVGDALLVSLPVSILAGIVGGALVAFSNGDWRRLGRRRRSEWTMERGLVVGAVVSTLYFVLLGGFHWGIPLLSVFGGIAGAAAGALVGACCGLTSEPTDS
jgi:hypothetical protein